MLEWLAICREHGQPPSWWGTLTPDDRVLLIATERIRRRRE